MASSSLIYTTRATTAAPDILRIRTGGYLLKSQNPADMDAFDNHGLHYEGDYAAERDDLNSGLPSLLHTPFYEMDAFSSTFEDPFSYQTSTFETLAEENNNASSSPGDVDNKLLGFGPPTFKGALFDDAGQTWPSMSADLFGMFFLAESVYNAGDTVGRPAELTCYRRNLFQISGTINLSRSLGWVLTEQESKLNIVDLMVSVSATESIEGKPTEIISVPWKTAANGTTSEDKTGSSPPPIPINLTSDQDPDPNSISLPISWKRLQFKHATANNGRRKGLQQHYLIHIELIATTNTGEKVKLAEIQSGPIIVRGRSPRNFDSRKDMPLSADRAIKSENQTGSARVRSTSGGNYSTTEPATPLRINADAAQNSYKFYALNALQTPLDLPDWANTTPPLHNQDLQRTPKRMNLPSTADPFIVPSFPTPSWNRDTPKIKRQNTGPIGLSLADDDFAGSGVDSLKSSVLHQIDSLNSPVASRKNITSPSDNTSADLLYEYFPLSVDDWMPPVDAIYRPHVVHHTITPPELKAQRSKSKRYFSAED